MNLYQNIATDSVVSADVNPTEAYTLIRDKQWGIDSVLPGFIIQSVNITQERMTDTTQDQKGAVVSQLDYDKHWTMTMEVIGGDGSEDGKVLPDNTNQYVDTTYAQPLVPGNQLFSWANMRWKITSVSYAGSFQDKKRYTVNAEAWANYPLEDTPADQRAFFRTTDNVGKTNGLVSEE